MKSQDKYNNKAYDRIALRVYKGQKQIIERIAKRHGISINSLINEAIEKEIERRTRNWNYTLDGGEKPVFKSTYDIEDERCTNWYRNKKEDE